MATTRNIRVEINSEIATSRDHARVLVYDNDKLVAEVIAEIVSEQGADGGFYNCVKLKKQFSEKSELEKLLEKNAYGEGLTQEEENRAFQLIANPVLSEDSCWVCKPKGVEKAIFDTGLCVAHAFYALVTRK